MSSLASQLKAVASIDAARLSSRHGQPSSKSYLFPASTASSYDFDALFTIALSGFDELVQLDAEMQEFEQELFSQAAKSTDRLMLNEEENAKLDKELTRCLRRLGKWIGIKAGGKCIEWLVRRFRVHELNVPAVLEAFLPYHASTHFPRILAILNIPSTSAFNAVLQPLVKDPQPLTRSALITALGPASDPSLRALREIMAFVPRAIEDSTVHRTLLTFWTGLVVDMIERQKGSKGGVQEGVVRILVESFVTLLQSASSDETAMAREIAAAVFPALILLARATPLAQGPVQVLVSALFSACPQADSLQVLVTSLIVLEASEQSITWRSTLGVALASIPDSGAGLVALSNKYNLYNGLAFLMQGAFEPLTEDNVKVIVGLLDSRDVHPIVSKQLTVSILSTLKKSGQEQELASALLKKLQKAYSDVLSSVTAQGDLDPSVVALVHASEGDSGDDAFLNSLSSDDGRRAAGVTALYAKLEEAASDASDMGSAKDILISRIADSSVAVLKALYASPDHLLKLVPGAEVLNVIAETVEASRISQKVLVAHVEFLAGPLAERHPELVAQVYRKVLFPHLLFTTESQSTTSAVWAVISRSPLAEHALFAGACKEASKVFDSSVAVVDAVSTIGLLEETNSLVAEILAQNIIQIGQQSNQNFLLEQLNVTAAHPRLLSHLVVANIIRRMVGHGQLQFAVKVLQLVIAQAGSGVSDDASDFDEPFAATYLKAIVSKPHEPRTARRSRASVLACMVGIEMPTNGVNNWLNSSMDDKQGAWFKQFSDALYVAANGTIVPTAFAGVLLRSLLASLREDALLFLARTWLFSESIAIKVSALRHAQAFMQAYVSGQTKKTTADFQVVLPAILLAIQDAAKPVRQAAVAIVKVLLNVTGEKAVDIYALDSVYAARSDVVQILKPADLHHYLQLISADSVELVQDDKRLVSLHSDILGLPHSQKKQASFRRSIISFLLSHVIAWRQIDARMGLLRSLQRVHDAVKLDALPLLSNLDNEADAENKWYSKLKPAVQHAYLEAVFVIFDRASAPALLVSDSAAWATLLRFIATTQSSDIAIALRKVALERLGQGLFSQLPANLQAEAVRALIVAQVELPTDVQLDTPAILEKCPLDATSLINLIAEFGEPLESSQLSKSKKSKVDHDEQIEQTEAALGSLSMLFASQDFNKLQPSIPLLSSLMSLLSHLIDASHIVPAGVDFVEQTVLTALTIMVSKITDAAEMLRAHVGVEVIVKLIRGSTNPRTAQQALLLIASLARLIPESVLHNIMPIFTFMGASDLQRDDAYSFKVVENTVEQIVPIMSQSLKQAAGSPLELFRESRTFLRIFTDMASRLPKHRTTPFFAHFARVVGPDDFLPAIVMLMVDQSCSKVAKASDAERLLELPLTLTKTFPVATQLASVEATVEEVERLCDGLEQQEPRAFLDVTVEADARKQPAYAATTAAQIQALLLYAKSALVALSGKACPQGPAELVVSRTLRLTSKISSSLHMSASEAAQASEEVLEAALQLLSVQTFLSIVLQQLQDGEEAVVATCLDSVIARLPLVREDVRLASSSTVSEIVKQSTTILGKLDINAEAAIDVLGVITAADVKAEDSVLTQVIPVLLSVAAKTQSTEIQIASYELLAVLLKRLGPRVIPYVKPVAGHAVAMLAKTNKSDVSSRIFAAASVMIGAVPTFIAAQQLQDLIHLSLNSRDIDDGDAHALLAVIAKRIPTKTLLPVIFDVWTKAKASKERSMILFFDLLRLAIRNADKTALPSLIKPLFGFYLEVFDMRHGLQLRGLEKDVIAKVETSAINSFLELVVKLNEATFKPLFVRLYDWAAIDLASDDASADVQRLNERKSVLFRVMTGLLTKFKHLLSPYVGILLPQIDELLSAYKAGSAHDAGLWNLLVAMLGKSFEVDDSAYWTEAGLLKLLPKLVAQITVAESFSSGPVTTDASCSVLYSTLGAMAASTTSEPVLKKLNNGILMATRQEEPRVRMVALCALDVIWEKQSDELLAFVPETVSEFLAELLEDENSEVEGLARKVLVRIEDLTGSLKEYLE